MIVKADIVYPITVEAFFPDETPLEQIEYELKKLAAETMQTVTVKAIIIGCSIPELED